MKPISFSNKTAQKIYDDYLKRINRMVASLDDADRKEIVMELNSHIYEGLSHREQNDEVDNLVDIIEKLGAPEEILKPLVAQKKLEQATRTFNPLDIFKALFLNISNGVAYVFFAVLYLALFGFIFLIVEKIKNPDQVGLYFKKGDFYLLGTRNPDTLKVQGLNEVLGNWFIPVMVISILVLYIGITFMLRLKRKK